MCTNNSESQFDIEDINRFRMVLGEYDIVATGITTLSQRLVSCNKLNLGDTNTAERLYRQLQGLGHKFEIDCDAIWPFQISDKKLSQLLIDLRTNHLGEDPVSALSFYINSIKRVLSPLSHILVVPRQKEIESNRALSSTDNSIEKIQNLERMAYELAFGRTFLHSTPIRLILNTTSLCNLRCLTCYQSGAKDIIHYDLADSALDSLATAFENAKEILIGGMGEPLLSRSARKLIVGAKDAGSYVELITNGTKLERFAGLLPYLDLIMISLDGGTPEAFNTIRRNGNFNKLISDIRNTSPVERAKICFNIVVCKQNVYTLDKCIELGQELGIGSIHLQEMHGYLPWHDLMTLDESERSWLFQQLPEWHQRAQIAGISLVCNLVPNPGPGEAINSDISEALLNNIAAISDVPVAPASTRMNLGEISEAFDDMLSNPTPDVMKVLSASLGRLSNNNKPGGPIDQLEVFDRTIDWKALRHFVDTGNARIPHCMSTYAQLIVNEDGTTRSCCTVQNRLASISQPTFAEIWNAGTYIELRAAHALQVAPREACRDCRDPVRFHFLAETLEILSRHNIDVTLIKQPKDFPIPESCRDHALVRMLGTNSANSAYFADRMARRIGRYVKRGFTYLARRLSVFEWQ